MKRIKSAYLQQTIHFQLKAGMNQTAAAAAVKQEYEYYKAMLERSRVSFQILDESLQPDGSIIIHIEKQCNAQNCDEYMN